MISEEYSSHPALLGERFDARGQHALCRDLALVRLGTDHSFPSDG